MEILLLRNIIDYSLKVILQVETARENSLHIVGHRKGMHRIIFLTTISFIYDHTSAVIELAAGIVIRTSRAGPRRAGAPSDLRTRLPNGNDRLYTPLKVSAGRQRWCRADAARLPAPIRGIPPEILRNIFKYVSYKDHFYDYKFRFGEDISPNTGPLNLLGVCRLWRRIAPLDTLCLFTQVILNGSKILRSK